MLIRGGSVVDEVGLVETDLRVKDGVILETGSALVPGNGEEIIDAAGCWILPGLVDPHLHIKLDTGAYRTPDDWEIGTRSAALGGVTTVVDFATQFPEQTYADALQARQAEARDRAIVDYGFHMMVTRQATAGSMATLRDHGVGAVKVYTTYQPNYFQDDAQLLAIMREAAAHRLLVMVHAENDAIVSAARRDLVSQGRTTLRWHGAARPECAEVEAAHRCCWLAREAGCELYIVHNSSHRTVDVITAAKATGQQVYSETCPQYLTLDETAYESEEPWRYILQPPLRAASCQDGLWERILDRRIDVVATDHCDYSVEQKREADDFTVTAGGLPGLDTLLALMHHEGSARGLKPSDLVRLLSANPARIFGLWPHKGNLAPGADGDVVIFNPEASWTIRGTERPGTAKYSPWEGREIRGRVRDVWSRGERVVADGTCVGTPGHGRYLRTTR